MEWYTADVQNLAIIDREVGEHTLSPAEYEIARQVICATADFDFINLIQFSPKALKAGAAALAARTTIVVDVPTVQAAIATKVQTTFANPIYCATEAITRPKKNISQATWGIETLAQRYPEAIFTIGEAQSALNSLIHLVEIGELKPALVIAASPKFTDIDLTRTKLQNSTIPHIFINGRKGNAVVAAAILKALIDISWQAYNDQGE
ncbi:precorrin-8X methylmutase [Pseudanabaena sp. PCC 6802]|uniref:precorrin-8X methylmutase n=1 Tax=Pseudanabaena sp. PCC 6802 TaxID=118173 RepID=UPI00034A6B1C|nr:precorrin-8X methylmutase [Pseudanabaena sp. PCC 6802]